jgi:hypothetical protein
MPVVYPGRLRVINVIAIVLCMVFTGNAPREIELHDGDAATLLTAPHALPAASLDRRYGTGDQSDGDRRTPFTAPTWSADACSRPLVEVACIAAVALAPPGLFVPTPSSRGPPAHS